MGTTPQSESQFEAPARDTLFIAAGRLRSIWRFLIAAIVVLLANYIAGTISYIAFGKHALVADAAYRLIAASMLIGAFCLMLKYFDEVVEGELLTAQGLPLRAPWIRNVLTGFALGFGLILLSVVAIALFGGLTLTVTVSSVAIRRAAVVIVLLAAGAMLEEVMFRGYPFQRLVESMGPWGAIFVLSVLFGAAHLSNPNSGGIRSWAFFNTIAVGILLALAYLRTGSLWFPFGFHFAWNFALGLVFGLPVSGINMFSVLIKAHASGPDLLTGGNYGIESSLTGAIVIVLGILVLFGITRTSDARIDSARIEPAGPTTNP